MATSKFRGYLLGIVAAAAYGTNPLFALSLYEGGMNPDSVLFFRYLLAIPILALMLVARGRGFVIGKKQIFPLFIFGTLMGLSSLSLFASYNFMPASIASTLLFIYPLMVAVIMAIGFKERMSLLTLICLIMAMAGIGLLFKGGEDGSLSLVGIFLVMVSSLTYAIYIIGVNKSKLEKMATLKVTFYVLLFGIWVFLLRFLCGVQLTVPSAADWTLWGNMLALAIFPTVVSFLCTTRAIQIIGATPTAILGAFEPVTAIFFGLTLFDEQLSYTDWIGVGFIIIAVMCVVGGSSIGDAVLRLRKLFPKRIRH